MSRKNVTIHTRSTENMKTIGEKIKDIRKSNKLTQQQFADSLGISRPHLSKIESNKENASDSVIKLISKLYDVNYEWLTSVDGTFSIEVSDFSERLKKIHELELGKTTNIFIDLLNNPNVKEGSRKYFINNMADIIKAIKNFYDKSDICDYNNNDVEIICAYIEKKLLASINAFKVDDLDYK